MAAGRVAPRFWGYRVCGRLLVDDRSVLRPPPAAQPYAAPAPQQSRVEVDFLQRMMPAFAPSPARPAFGQLAAIVPMPHVGN
jgi:hypothetical protein